MAQAGSRRPFTSASITGQSGVFVVDEVALGKVLLRALQFCRACIIPPVLQREATSAPYKIARSFIRHRRYKILAVDVIK